MIFFACGDFFSQRTQGSKARRLAGTQMNADYDDEYDFFACGDFFLAKDAREQGTQMSADYDDEYDFCSLRSAFFLAEGFR
jgi:hypothetical protein